MKSIVNVAGCTSTVVGSFGEIVFWIVGGEIFVFQSGVGDTKAGGVVHTFFEHATNVVVALGRRNGPPPKQWGQRSNGGFSFARTTRWAYNAGPIGVVGRRVVEVLVVATGGGGGPGRFGTGGAFCIGFFAFDETCFAGLLAAGVLVLVGGAARTVALAAAITTQIATGADGCAGEGGGVAQGAYPALRGVGVGAASGVAHGAFLAPIAVGAGAARGACGAAGQRGPTRWAINARGVSSFFTVIRVGSARFTRGITGGIAKFTGAAFNARCLSLVVLTKTSWTLFTRGRIHAAGTESTSLTFIARTVRTNTRLTNITRTAFRTAFI